MSSSTLEDFLCDKRTVLNFDGICAVATDVISAIERLEDHGILHNNVTTRNILIGPCTRVSKPMCPVCSWYVVKLPYISYQRSRVKHGNQPLGGEKTKGTWHDRLISYRFLRVFILLLFLFVFFRFLKNLVHLLFMKLNFAMVVFSFISMLVNFSKRCDK